MAVNWNILAAYPNAGESFANAFKQGQDQNRQNATRDAMGKLVQNPNDPQALANLAKLDPATAMQFRQQQMEQNKALLAQHQDSIIKGAEILRQFNPTDQQSYSQALAAAQRAGIDISEVPQQFDPNYVQSVIHVADAFKPQPSDTQIIPLQPGGSAVRYNKTTGQVEPLVVPNPGGQAVGAPAGGAAPMTATGPNGEKIHLNPQTGQWEPMGGPASQAPGGFPSSYSDIGPYHRY